MKCQFCGYENERGAAFCENCGQKLSPQSGKETKAKEKKQRQPRPAKEPRPPRQKKSPGSLIPDPEALPLCMPCLRHGKRTRHRILQYLRQPASPSALKKRDAPPLSLSSLFHPLC